MAQLGYDAGRIRSLIFVVDALWTIPGVVAAHRRAARSAGADAPAD